MTRKKRIEIDSLFATVFLRCPRFSDVFKNTSWMKHWRPFTFHVISVVVTDTFAKKGLREVVSSGDRKRWSRKPRWPKRRSFERRKRPWSLHALSRVFSGRKGSHRKKLHMKMVTTTETKGRRAYNLCILRPHHHGEEEDWKNSSIAFVPFSARHSYSLCFLCMWLKRHRESLLAMNSWWMHAVLFIPCFITHCLL